MKIVLPGGSGQLGVVLARAFRARGDDVVVLSRAEGGAGPAAAVDGARAVAWDARTVGPWAAEIDGATSW